MLTRRRELFVEAYLQTLNAAEAVRRAYPLGVRWADRVGYRMLRNVEVAEAIQARQRERLERMRIRADDVLAELAALAYTDLPDVVAWDSDGNYVVSASKDLPPRARKALKKIRIKRKRLLVGDETKNGGQDTAVWELEDFSVELHDKERAIQMLMRHLGLLPTGGKGAGAADGGPLMQQNNFYVNGQVVIDGRQVPIAELFRNFTPEAMVKLLGLPADFLEGPPVPEPTDGED